jgi:gas vesicle protein
LSDIHRSESSPTNADESKQIKSLISDLQDDLKDSQTQIDDKLESNITDLQSRFNQMENRFDRWLKEMKEVGVIDVHHETSLFSIYI